ncbi:MAG: hypothetical protein ACRD1B_01940 [Thermoanaerobaculia bacterium]
MRNLVRVSALVVALILVCGRAKADCKKCVSAYCYSVRDLQAGNDGCRITTERLIHVGLNGVWIEWRTKCDPVGESCTNLHIDITVNGGDFEYVGSP